MDRRGTLTSANCLQQASQQLHHQRPRAGHGHRQTALRTQNCTVKARSVHSVGKRPSTKKARPCVDFMRWHFREPPPLARLEAQPPKGKAVQHLGSPRAGLGECGVGSGDRERQAPLAFPRLRGVAAEHGSAPAARWHGWCLPVQARAGSSPRLTARSLCLSI